MSDVPAPGAAASLLSDDELVAALLKSEWDAADGVVASVPPAPPGDLRGRGSSTSTSTQIGISSPSHWQDSPSPWQDEVDTLLNESVGESGAVSRNRSQHDLLRDKEQQEDDDFEMAMRLHELELGRDNGAPQSQHPLDGPIATEADLDDLLLALHLQEEEDGIARDGRQQPDVETAFDAGVFATGDGGDMGPDLLLARHLQREADEMAQTGPASGHAVELHAVLPQGEEMRDDAIRNQDQVSRQNDTRACAIC